MGPFGGRFGGRFWALIASTFLGFLGIGTVLPRLGPHVRFDLGGSDQTVGLVIGTFSFVALGSRLFAGALADRGDLDARESVQDVVEGERQRLVDMPAHGEAVRRRFET